MSLSRRDLLAKFSLSLPAAAVLALAANAEAETTGAGAHHPKRKHHGRAASRKHGHKTAARSRTAGEG